MAPFVDHWIGGKWLLDYRLSAGAALALAVSCTVAIGVNMSQFACLGRFQAVTFQVSAHILPHWVGSGHDLACLKFHADIVHYTFVVADEGWAPNWGVLSAALLKIPANLT